MHEVDVGGINRYAGHDESAAEAIYLRSVERSQISKDAPDYAKDVIWSVDGDVVHMHDGKSTDDEMYRRIKSKQPPIDPIYGGQEMSKEQEDRELRLPVWAQRELKLLRDRVKYGNDAMLKELVVLRPKVEKLQQELGGIRDLLDCAAKGGHMTSEQIINVLQSYDLTVVKKG